MSFLEGFLSVGEKGLLLFIFIALGVVCQKIKFLTDETNKCISNIIMYIVTPCVIINAFARNLYDRGELLGILKNIGIVAIIAFLAHGFMIAISILVFRFKDEDRTRLLRFGAVFSNAGFIALPLAQALIDTPASREGTLYAAVYLAVFNIVIWTWGLYDMSRGESVFKPKKILLNPGLIGVIVGLFFFTSPLYITVGGEAGIRLPEIILEALEYTSAVNLPLPMMMVGYYLGKANLKRAFTDLYSYLCMAMRLVIFPLLMLGILYLIGIRGNVLTVSVIGLCAPVGATTTMFATKFDRDTELSVSLVSLSTVISLVTMPLIVGLTQVLA